MSNKSSGGKQVEKAAEFIEKHDTFHDPASHGRPPPGLQYAPEPGTPSEKPKGPKKKHGTQSQGHHEGE